MFAVIEFTPVGHIIILVYAASPVLHFIAALFGSWKAGLSRWGILAFFLGMTIGFPITWVAGWWLDFLGGKIEILLAPLAGVACTFAIARGVAYAGVRGPPPS
jgi:uncharacterized protein YqgC (DUF456 family)